MTRPRTGESVTKTPWLRSFKRALILWGAWRALLSLWGGAILQLGLIDPGAGIAWLHGFIPASHGLRASLIDLWMRWDSVHYLRIIQDGYGPDERSVFFPLYPLLGKVFGALTGGENLLGLLIVSNLAAIGCFTLLDQLGQAFQPEDRQGQLLLSLVFIPSAFFLLVAYPQSLVLFFTLAAYLALKRGRFVLSTLCGLLAGLTHSTALPLAVLLFVAGLSARKDRRAWFLPALGPPLGIGGFLIWRVYAGLPSYLAVQWTMSSRGIGLGIDFEGVMTAWTWFLRGWPNLLVLAYGVGTLIWCYRRRRMDWFWFLAALILIPVLSAPGFEPLDGLARYALAGFPLLFALAAWLPGGWKRLAALAIAIGMNLYLSGLFILWGFVG